MDIIFTHDAGLAGHQQTVMACRATPEPTGQPADGLMEGQAFGPTTAALLAWSARLAEAGTTQGAMDSTGEDWKPVYPIWAGAVAVFLVNAADVQPVPGRQTDKAEARRQATRRRDGVLQGQRYSASRATRSAGSDARPHRMPVMLARESWKLPGSIRSSRRRKRFWTCSRAVPAWNWTRIPCRRWSTSQASIAKP